MPDEMMEAALALADGFRRTLAERDDYTPNDELLAEDYVASNKRICRLLTAGKRTTADLVNAHVVALQEQMLNRAWPAQRDGRISPNEGGGSVGA